MKWFVTILLVLATVATLVWFSLQDPGFIVIGRGVWTIETSLSAFIIVLVLGWFVIYIFIRLLRIVWRLPKHLFHDSAVQQQKAFDSLVRGLLALIQGQWQSAEQLLLKTVSAGELSALHYVGAAYAASQQQALARTTDYLSKARKSLPKEEVAFTLFEANLQLQQQDLTTALENAQQAYRIAPKQEEVLSLLVTLYVQLADWQALLELLPEVRKRKVLSTEQLQQLENRASIALIHHALRTNPLQANKIWAQIPKTLRLRPVVLKVYVEHLIAAGDAVTAEPLLREALKYQWDADLVVLYGELETPNTSQQINYAENWLKSHENDPVLQFTLGRLCLRNRLWDKAQQYLEESMHLAANPKTYQLLGELSTQRGKLAQASDYYQRGLQLAITT